MPFPPDKALLANDSTTNHFPPFHNSFCGHNHAKLNQPACGDQTAAGQSANAVIRLPKEAGSRKRESPADYKGSGID